MSICCIQTISGVPCIVKGEGYICLDHLIEYGAQVVAFNALKELPAIPVDICSLIVNFLAKPEEFNKNKINDKINEMIGSLPKNKLKDRLIIAHKIYQCIADNHTIFMFNNKA